ncbi:hypothetical protein FQZ97_1249620 [compost metagenome]
MSAGAPEVMMTLPGKSTVMGRLKVSPSGSVPCTSPVIWSANTVSTLPSPVSRSVT